MPRTVLGAAVLAALLLGAPASASAGTLDQQQTSSSVYYGLTSAFSAAQTFTAGITGGLDQADLELEKAGTPPATLTVEIRSTSAGTPTATVLASGAIPASAVGASPAFVAVTFAMPPAVTAGSLYALVAHAPGAPFNAFLWATQNTGDPYPRGESFGGGDPLPPGANWDGVPAQDRAFKTYVNPSNSFGVGAITRNKKKGTATLNLTLPNPGDLAGSGNGAKVSSSRAVTSKSVGAGQAQLLIKAKGKKKRKLNETGKVKVNVAITYTPTGGDPATQSVKVKLKKNLPGGAVCIGC